MNACVCAGHDGVQGVEELLLDSKDLHHDGIQTFLRLFAALQMSHTTLFCKHSPLFTAIISKI